MKKSAIFIRVFGDLATAMDSAGYFAGGQRAEVRENVLRCTLEPGDELPVTVKPLRLKVRVKIEQEGICQNGGCFSYCEKGVCRVYC